MATVTVRPPARRVALSRRRGPSGRSASRRKYRRADWCRPAWQWCGSQARPPAASRQRPARRSDWRPSDWIGLDRTWRFLAIFGDSLPVGSRPYHAAPGLLRRDVGGAYHLGPAVRFSDDDLAVVRG